MPPLSLAELKCIYGSEYTEAARQQENADDEYSPVYVATHRQMDLVESMVKKGTALNVGAISCGSRVLEQRGWELTVLDASEYAANTARRQWGLNAVVGSVADVSLPEDSFDFVKLGHVIEHVADPRLVLRNLYHSLRDGGIILIDTDNALGVRARLEGLFRQILTEELAVTLVRRLTGKNLSKRYGRLAPPVHVYTFSPESLGLLLAGAGFSIVRVLEPAWGDRTWFPLVSTARFTFLERVFMLVDRLGARLFGHGDVLVVFARKAASTD